MLEAIGAARHHVHVEYCIIRNDELRPAVHRCARREGARRRDGPARLRRRRVRPCRPALLPPPHGGRRQGGSVLPGLFGLVNFRINFRNHRKILVVDGDVGFIGGYNIGVEYLGEGSPRPLARRPPPARGRRRPVASGTLPDGLELRGPRLPRAWVTGSSRNRGPRGPSPARIASWRPRHPEDDDQGGTSSK